MNFCPGCGKRIKVKFCTDCMPVEKLDVKEIVVIICSVCKKYFSKNKWKYAKSAGEAVINVATECIKNAKDFKIVLPKDFKVNEGAKNNIEINVLRQDYLFKVPVSIIGSRCEECSSMVSRYFEGVLQLRNADENISKFIESFVKKNKVNITTTVKQNNGVDFNFSDKRKLQNLGNKLQKEFGGILKSSPRLFTKNSLTSKDVYRLNVYYEGPAYKKGDVIKTKNMIILISGIKKNVTGTDLKTGKKVTVVLKEREFEILKPIKTTVSKVYPKIEVLNPESYQSTEVMNSKNVKLGEKINVVEDDGLFYII